MRWSAANAVYTGMMVSFEESVIMDLKDEILGGESYSLEFKRVPNEEREKYLKTVVAFANGRGARILFGVANDRTVVGIPNGCIFAEVDGVVNSICNAA